LAFIARTLSANSRSFDLYGRWGGEEFIGIIRNVEEKELAGLGDRIRMLVEKAFLEHGEKKLRVTLSIGATMATDDDTADTLLERADRMMYEGKSAGRNRLILG
jgi:diguanylate cyclase (GGDEF)-like protein